LLAGISKTHVCETAHPRRLSSTPIRSAIVFSGPHCYTSRRQYHLGIFKMPDRRPWKFQRCKNPKARLGIVLDSRPELGTDQGFAGEQKPNPVEGSWIFSTIFFPHIWRKIGCSCCDNTGGVRDSTVLKWPVPKKRTFRNKFSRHVTACQHRKLDRTPRNRSAFPRRTSWIWGIVQVGKWKKIDLDRIRRPKKHTAVGRPK
jgi:hypothetical protein